MSILPQNTVEENEITERRYDTAGIRCLTLDEQAAYRERMVALWLKLCDGSRTVKAAAAIVGIPFSTLNRWKKQPRPKSTRPHNVRNHDDQEA